MELYRFDIFGDYCLHAITQKDASLPLDGSLALHTNEPIELVLYNRRNLFEQLGLFGWNIVLANQTHSTNIEVVTQNQSRGWESCESAISDCDGLVTNQKNILIGILTADCVPILLYDKSKEVVAALHAGWQGTRGGIAKKMIKKMVDIFGSNPDDIVAGIGPSIGACCYEVSSDVSDYFEDGVKIQKANGKYMLDLKSENYNQLIKAGLKESNIELSSLCTSHESDKFFSYRKEQGCSGRFLSIIGLAKKP